jgi:hypothetical protein
MSVFYKLTANPVCTASVMSGIVIHKIAIVKQQVGNIILINHNRVIKTRNRKFAVLSCSVLK